MKKIEVPSYDALRLLLSCDRSPPSEKDELDSVKWLPADVLVVNEIFKRYKNPLEGAKLRSTMKKKKIVFA